MELRNRTDRRIDFSDGMAFRQYMPVSLSGFNTSSHNPPRIPTRLLNRCEFVWLTLLALFSILHPVYGFANTIGASDENSMVSDRTSSRSSISKHSIRCYSCMSPFYESAWILGLSRIYAKPMNFSQQCDDSGRLRGISLVECPSICIKIREDTELSGIPFRGYIRGCYDTMLLHGFNQTLVRWFRWLQRDSCLDYNKYHILQLPPPARQQSKPSTLHICTCYADSCNGSPRISGASVTRLTCFGRSFAFSLITVACPLLVLAYWCCWTLHTDLGKESVNNDNLQLVYLNDIRRLQVSPSPCRIPIWQKLHTRCYEVESPRIPYCPAEST